MTKPAPDFTLLDLLRELKAIEPREIDQSPRYWEEGYFRTEELSELLGVEQKTIVKWLKELRRKGWQIVPRRVDIIRFDGQPAKGTAYKVLPKDKDGLNKS